MSGITKNSTGPDLALIKEYASPWDRQSPPVFVGRKEEIELVENNCRRAFARFQQRLAPAGHIVIFQGALGSGKSSLLEHLEKHWNGKTDPLVISVPESNLKTSASVVRTIGEHVFPDGTKKLDEKTVSSTRGRLGAWIFDLEGSRTKETGPKPVDFRVLANLKPREQWERPVCLLVDEIQTVTQDHGECLRQLQSGEHGLPIVLVGAGLADSAEKLQQAMSPCLTSGNLRTLGALAPEEVQSCVRQMFDWCRVNYTAGQLKQFAGEIAERSEGWPQHVRTGTSALFGELAETRGDLERVDSRAVKQRADTYREDSYRARQSEVMGRAGHLVASVLKMIPEGGAPVDHVVDIIEAKADQTGQKSWRLPKGMDAEDILDHLIHQGIFQPDETGLLSCPIPSLWTWLIEQPSRRRQGSSQSQIQAGRGALEMAVNKMPDQSEPDRNPGAVR